MVLLQGILYASHVSATPLPGPTNSCTRLTTTVLTTHPNRMMRLVKKGWQSSTTILKKRSRNFKKLVLQSHDNTTTTHAPRNPNPADIPPSKLRTSHVRSRTSSSKRCQSGLSNGILYTYDAGGGVSFGICGPQMERTTRSKNLVSEE
jgi:hypothetical protein